MILSKLKEFYTSHRKRFFYILVFGFLFYISQDLAFAETPSAKSLSTEGVDVSSSGANKNAIIEVVSWLITIASSLIAILSGFVSLFLHPGWINGTVLGFDIFLKEIWIMISNIVYFMFAFVLIAIAFMNIIGKGQDVWEMKQALPKFVIGVLMVPFSWFFVQFILSISAMLTVAVLSLPYETLNGKDAFKNAENTKICTKFIISLKKSEETTGGTKSTGLSKDGKCAYGNKKTSIQELLRGDGEGISSSVFGLINIYTYSIMDISGLEKLNKDKLSGIKTLTDASLKVIFDLLFMVVYMILMIALFMALFARATWLWIHAMFSPVYGLLFFFGKAKEGVGDQKFGVGEFIKLAFVPVYVSAALSFGLIFIFVAAHGLSTDKGNNSRVIGLFDKKNGEEIKTIKEGDYSKASNIPGLSIGAFTIYVDGTHGGETGKAAKVSNELFASLGNGLGQIILELFGLAILWIALMAALKSSQVTESVTEPIRAFGKSVGSLVAKSPQYAPIIPTGKGMISASGLNQGATNVISGLQTGIRNKHADKFGSFFGNVNKLNQKSDEVLTYLQNNGSVTNDKVYLGIREAILSAKDSNELATNDKFKDVMNLYGTKIFKGDKTGLKEFSDLLKLRDGDSIAKALHLVDKKADATIGNKHSIYTKFSSKRSSEANKTSLDNYIKTGTESTTASGATTATAKQNTAINIKSINNNTISTSKEVGGDLKTIKVEGIDIKSDLSQIIDFNTGKALTATATATNDIQNILKTKNIKINGTKATDDQIIQLAKQILKETEERMKPQKQKN